MKSHQFKYETLSVEVSEFYLEKGFAASDLPGSNSLEPFEFQDGEW